MLLGSDVTDNIYCLLGDARNGILLSRVPGSDLKPLCHAVIKRSAAGTLPLSDASVIGGGNVGKRIKSQMFI